MIRPRVWAGGTVPWIWIALAAAGSESDQATIDAHRASRDSIRTCACTFKVAWTQDRGSSKDVRQLTGKYYRAGATSRLIADSGKHHVDILRKNSKVWDVTKEKFGPGEALGAGVRVDDGRPAAVKDPWTEGLFAFWLPDSKAVVPLEELLAKATRRRIRSEGGGDRPDSIITVIVPPYDEFVLPDGWESEIRLSGARNYLADRVVITQKLKSGHVLKTEMAVRDFKEISPGLFFPVRTESKSYGDGKFLAGVECEIEQLSVNKPLPPGVLELTYPKGIMFTDQIRRVRYKVDSAGRPITPETSTDSPSTAPTAPPDRSEPPGTETAVERQSRLHWYLLGGAMLTLSTAVLLRRRGNRQPAAG